LVLSSFDIKQNSLWGCFDTEINSISLSESYIITTVPCKIYLIPFSIDSLHPLIIHFPGPKIAEIFLRFIIFFKYIFSSGCSRLDADVN